MRRTLFVGRDDPGAPFGSWGDGSPWRMHFGAADLLLGRFFAIIRDRKEWVPCFKFSMPPTFTWIPPSRD